jgi:hypothetical protein
MFSDTPSPEVCLSVISVLKSSCWTEKRLGNWTGPWAVATVPTVRLPPFQVGPVASYLPQAKIKKPVKTGPDWLQLVFCNPNPSQCCSTHLGNSIGGLIFKIG